MTTQDRLADIMARRNVQAAIQWATDLTEDFPKEAALRNIYFFLGVSGSRRHFAHRGEYACGTYQECAHHQRGGKLGGAGRTQCHPVGRIPFRRARETTRSGGRGRSLGRCFSTECANSIRHPMDQGINESLSIDP
jgi:hypothetical protein